MAKHRFYAPPEAFSPDGATVELAPDEAHHLRDALRLKTGAEVFVFDGQGREFRCIVRKIDRRDDAISLDVAEKVAPQRPESPLDLTLALALLKGEKFDLVVQKATELGATRIVPLMTRFADVKLSDQRAVEKRLARWQRLAIEAAKQCGRARLPALLLPIAFSDFAENGWTELVAARTATQTIMFTERDGESLLQAVAAYIPLKQAIAVVGPEGGWDDEEIRRARHAGWQLVTLGGRTLRAETAAIVAVTLLEHLHGDLR